MDKKNTAFIKRGTELFAIGNNREMHRLGSGICRAVMNKSGGGCCYV